MKTPYEKEIEEVVEAAKSYYSKMPKQINFKKADIYVGNNLHHRVVIWEQGDMCSYVYESEIEMIDGRAFPTRPPLTIKKTTLLQYANKRGGKNNGI